MRIIGFDGKKIKRKIEKKGEQTHWFEALIGVGITIEDYDKFVEKYDSLIENFFKTNGLVRNKPLYKASDLVSIFYGQGIDLIPQMAEQLLKLVDFIDVYFHYIPPYYDKKEQVPNKIGVYYDEEMEHLTNVEFIDLIINHFPALCCYSYLQTLKTEVKGTKYCIDECPVLLQSHATVSIIKHPDTRFLFRGDQVNYAINAADIFCRYIEERAKREDIKIDQNLVQNLGLPNDKVRYHFISHRWLHVIKPARRIKLNANHKYPHPIYFLFTETESAFKDSRLIIEKSSLFREALRKASIEGGSVKFFESADQEYINEKDFLITHTENTDRKTKELQRLGCPAKIIDFSFFEKK